MIMMINILINIHNSLIYFPALGECVTGAMVFFFIKFQDF